MTSIDLPAGPIPLSAEGALQAFTPKMSGQQTTRFADFLFGLTAMQQVLIQDCEYALQEAFRVIDPPPTDIDSLPELVRLERMVWLRVAVRTFLTWPDATTAFMRRAALSEAEHGYVRLPESLLKKLRRKRPLKDRVKEGFKAWTMAFQVDTRLETDGREWESFRRLTDARHRATHPAKLEHLYPVEAASSLLSSVSWYLMQMESLTRISAAKLGFDQTELPAPQLPELNLEELQTPALPNDQIDADSRQSLSLHSEMLRQLFHEVLYLLDWLKRHDLRRLETPQSQFAVRTAVRSVCSVTEGLGWSAHRFLAAAQARGEISLGRSFQRRIDKADSALDRVVAILDGHSAAFGNSYRVDRSGEASRRFKEIWRLRDRLTHPERLSDLMLSPDVVHSLAMALDWHIREVGNALNLDVDRWADLTTPS